MHRDKKLGLALGVLLIGIVGAFFFRNEQKDDRSPELKNPEELDRQIAEKPLTPYLTGVETDEPQPVAPERQAVTLGEPRYEVPDFLNDPSIDFEDSPFAAQPGPPDPIRTTPAAPAPVITPDHNRAWDVVTAPVPAPRAAGHRPVSRQSSRATNTSANATSDGAMILYRVKPGDTLSALAARYLGSHRRYQEIYEANHNVLANPNDLRAGMTIRIPQRQTARKPAEPALPTFESEHSPFAPEPHRDVEASSISRETPKADSVAPEQSAPAQPSRKFVPYRRSPFSPAGSMETSQDDAAPAETETISQGPEDITKRRQ